VRRAALLLAAVALGAAHAAEPKLPELKVAYAISWNGMSLGNASITLKPGDRPDCYRYESVSDPVGIVKMFYGQPRETSEFCVRGGRVVPKRFSYDNRGDSFTLTFEPGRVRDGKGGVREIPANAQDRFGIQQAVRLWVVARAFKKDPGTVDFTMVDDERIKTYRFAITAYEDIETPAGRFETVLVQRVDNPRRSSKFWLAPSRDFMPVKVEQHKDGDSDLRMVLLPDRK